MKIREWLKDATEQLESQAIDAPEREAQYLLRQCLKITNAQMILDDEREISKLEKARLQIFLTKRSQRMPLAYITGNIDFYKKQFLTSKNVLAPRADSETFLTALHEVFPNFDANLTLLELATGTGAIGMSALGDYPNMTAILSDVSHDALDIAYQNADRLGVRSRTQIVNSNWTSAIAPQNFDIIIVNPPYIPSAEIANLAPEVRDFEPHLALDGGIDGLSCYRLLNHELPPFCGDACLLEIGFGQKDSVVKIMSEFTYQKAWQDIQGIDRILLFRSK